MTETRTWIAIAILTLTLFYGYVGWTLNRPFIPDEIGTALVLYPDGTRIER